MKLIRTNEKWKKFLTAEQYSILRERGTEPAFADGNYYFEKRAGDYFCIACNNLLFSSKDKYESGTGWPSFKKPASDGSIMEGNGVFKDGKEISCKRCGGHLGHIFDDGPKPFGLRYCINGKILEFIPNSAEIAVFAAGCFWHIQHVFNKLPLIKTYAGYTGGNDERFPSPDYEQVSHGKTGHMESVKIIYDPKKISYKKLLSVFWNEHDPTSRCMQGNDIGDQYLAAIFFTNTKQKNQAEKSLEEIKKKYKGKNIFTTIRPAKIFYKAELYHQNHLEKINSYLK